MKFFLLFLISLNGFAVTEFVCNINKATGQDYDTITLWEAAIDDAGDLTDGSVLTGDWDNQSGSDIADAAAVTWDTGASSGTLIHMTATQYLIDVASGTLENDDTVSDGTNTFDVNGVPDSAILRCDVYDDSNPLVDQVTVSGNTVSATNYLILSVHSSVRHNGLPGTGLVLDPDDASVSADGINYGLTYGIIEWFEVTDWTGYIGFDQRFAITCTADSSGAGVGSTIRHCIIHDNGDDTRDAQHGLGNNRGNRAHNNLIYDVPGGIGIFIRTTFGADNNYYNNTVYNCSSRDNFAQFFVQNGNTGTVHNNVSIDPAGTGDCFSWGNGTITHDFNVSSDATADGANSINSGDSPAPSGSDFQDPTTTFDFTPVSASAWEDQGNDLGTSPDQVNIDLKSRDRDGEGDTWSMGAIQFVAAAPADRNRLIFVN